MAEQVRILTARRAYEFPVGGIRLTMLSTAQMPNTIQQHFDFQAGGITTPPQIFGEVPATMPPGLVFNLGSIQSPEGVLTPIRFMHFESQRIVIDVAGHSSAIDQVFERLLDLLSEVPTPDGSPLIGEPSGTIDYSEVSAQLGFDLGELISEPLRTVAQDVLTEGEEGLKALPVFVAFQIVEPSAVIEQPAAGQQIQIRAETRADERIYFSAMGWPTDKNLAWLEALDRQLGHA